MKKIKTSHIFLLISILLLVGAIYNLSVKVPRYLDHTPPPSPDEIIMENTDEDSFLLTFDKLRVFDYCGGYSTHVSHGSSSANPVFLGNTKYYSAYFTDKQGKNYAVLLETTDSDCFTYTPFHPDEDENIMEGIFRLTKPTENFVNKFEEFSSFSYYEHTISSFNKENPENPLTDSGYIADLSYKSYQKYVELQEDLAIETVIGQIIQIAFGLVLLKVSFFFKKKEKNPPPVKRIIINNINNNY